MIGETFGDHEQGQLRERLLEVHARLCRTYQCPIAYFHELDPVSELVSSLLSHRTKNADSKRAFDLLLSRFGSWEGVRDAEPREVRLACASTTWPEQKAPRIQEVLRRVTSLRGRLELDFLADLNVGDARAWLEALPGVGPKTSGAVLLFSHLHRPVMVVDSHHYRVAQRMGLLPSKLAEGPAHAFLEARLPAEWTAQQLYDHHEIFMLHGQRCCYAARPACERCPVLDLCPTGRARQAH